MVIGNWTRYKCVSFITNDLKFASRKLVYAWFSTNGKEDVRDAFPDIDIS